MKNIFFKLIVFFLLTTSLFGSTIQIPFLEIAKPIISVFAGILPILFFVYSAILILNLLGIHKKKSDNPDCYTVDGSLKDGCYENKSGHLFREYKDKMGYIRRGRIK